MSTAAQLPVVQDKITVKTVEQFRAILNSPESKTGNPVILPLDLSDIPLTTSQIYLYFNDNRDRNIVGLNIVVSDNETTLGPLPRIIGDNLETLIVKPGPSPTAAGLQEILGLGLMSKLKTLKVVNFPVLQELEGVDQLQGLEKLILSGCSSLSFAYSAASFPRLAYLNNNFGLTQPFQDEKSSIRHLVYQPALRDKGSLAIAVLPPNARLSDFSAGVESQYRGAAFNTFGMTFGHPGGPAPVPEKKEAPPTSEQRSKTPPKVKTPPKEEVPTEVKEPTRQRSRSPTKREVVVPPETKEEVVPTRQRSRSPTKGEVVVPPETKEEVVPTRPRSPVVPPEVVRPISPVRPTSPARQSRAGSPVRAGSPLRPPVVRSTPTPEQRVSPTIVRSLSTGAASPRGSTLSRAVSSPGGSRPISPSAARVSPTTGREPSPSEVRLHEQKTPPRSASSATRETIPQRGSSLRRSSRSPVRSASTIARGGPSSQVRESEPAAEEIPQQEA
jgi:hypothetical protein